MIKQNNHLNLFRLIFALQVVYMHSVDWLELPTGGDIIYDIIILFPCVPLFFMTLGFLISDSYLKSPNLKKYFYKRCIRIYPALIISIIVLEFSMFVGGNMDQMSCSLFDYLCYLSIYILTASSGVATTVLGVSGYDIYNFEGFFKAYPSGVLWTLSVELSFYLLLPLILVFNKALFRNTILVVSSFVSIIISMYASPEIYVSSGILKLLHISVFPYIWIFNIGVFIRLYYSNIKYLIYDKGIYYLIIYILISYSLFFFFDAELSLNSRYKYDLDMFTVLKIIFLSFSALSLAFTGVDRIPRLKTDLSYAIYLYHMLVIHILIGCKFDANAFTYILILFPSFIVASISWFCIEKPFLKFKLRI